MATAKRAVGSKDSALAGSNRVLIHALKELYDCALREAGITDSQVKRVFASGMVTSPYGLKEAIHLVAPLPLAHLAENTVSHYEETLFNRHIHLIRGVRTGGPLAALDEDNVANVNNMRGEEIELLGIHSMVSDQFGAEGYAVVNPGSHTHVSFLRDGCLEDIFSTFSGELYHAIVSGTILGGTVDGSAPPDYDAAQRGFLALEEYGMNRALYTCHAQRLFGVNDAARRKSYLEGVLCGGLITAIRRLCQTRWKDAKHIIVSQGTGSGILRHLLEQAIPALPVSELSPAPMGSFALAGMCEILRMI